MRTKNILDNIVQGIKEDNQLNFSKFNNHRFILRDRSQPIDILKQFKSGFTFIAEIKRGSPSRGIIREDFDPAGLASLYRDGGADAISVITEKNYFFGKPRDLDTVRQHVNLPLLRKDFIVHPYQIYEAYNLGADFILLITAILNNIQLKSFYSITRELGMEALIEIHDENELNRLLSLGLDFKILGINNRDLKTFQVNINNSFRIKKKFDQWMKNEEREIYVVSESGIKNRSDILSLKKNGFSGALVGESLLRMPDIKGGMRRWLR